MPRMAVSAYITFWRPSTFVLHIPQGTPEEERFGGSQATFLEGSQGGSRILMLKKQTLTDFRFSGFTVYHRERERQ